MANSRVRRGRRTEAAVAAYLAQHGWPLAERVPASIPGADITGVVDLSIEVKARSDFHPRAWLAQAVKNADGRLPLAVVRMNGQGEDAGEYLAFTRLADLVPVLREAGYGEPIDAPSGPAPVEAS